MAREFFQRVDSWLDATGEKLEKKTMRLYIDIIGPIVMMAFAGAVLFLMPSQINVLATGSITERSFPILLMILILAGGTFLLVKEIFNIAVKKKANVVETNLLVEVKALIILAILALFWLLLEVVGFAISSIVMGMLMLLFFRVKKIHYYVIVAATALIITFFFQYVLNVRLP